MIARKTLLTAALICATLGLDGLAHASPPACQAQCAKRSPGLTWSLLQSAPRHWTEGQPIVVSLGLGPSNPRYGEARGNRSLVDEAATSATPATGAPGWTRPLGLRFSIRW